MSISITSSTAGTLQYSGLTSDTNWVDVVDELMKVERFTINKLSEWKQEWADKITSLQGLDSRLLILETIAGNMSKKNEFYSRISSSSNEDVLEVTNTSAATPGAHSVTMQCLAQVEVQTHSGFEDENTSFVTTADGTFSYTYGDVTRTVDVSANSTLSDLRGLINNDTDNPGVTAVIINDGSGSETAFHLQLIGNDSGADYTIEDITHDLDNFANGGGSGFSETQSAQNAMLKVDGYPTGEGDYIERASNTIGDLISGVTISLTGTGTSTISITDDTDTIKEKIEEFVETVNTVLDYIREQTAYDKAGNGENNGVMIGNYGFQIVQRRINSILSTPVPGLTDGTDTYTRLSQIGIKTDPDQNGKWVIDNSALQSALNNDLDSVCNLFTRNEITDVSGIAELVRDETDKLTKDYSDANPGIVSVLVNNYNDIISNIDSKIEREERRLAMVENRLNTKFTQLEVLLGELQGQSDYLTAVLENLPQIGKD
ncbi:MAG: flagellar filament capping protein FliD [Deltaproteobacteria bacterium]|nr:flagellar filament capping protein FliD [Deltaproteobacteria bacterium]